MGYNLTVCDLLVIAMGGRGRLSTKQIYKLAELEFQQHKRPIPAEFDSEIRQTLQAFCKFSKQYKGGAHLFENVERGYWICVAQGLTELIPDR